MIPLDLQLRPALASRARLQTDPVTGEPVLLFPEGLLVLNPTAHEIVSRCDGAATVGEMIAALAEEYDAPADALAVDVVACLTDLRGRNLITLKA
jgi:pyrroloquinoline quinone biosynthesis protein D